MNFINRLLVAFSLALSSVTFSKDQQGRDWEETKDVTEREEERDEWTTMIHHDDVTLLEQAMLNSDDPAQIKEARDAIFIRQEEFKEWWDDRENRNACFYGEYHKAIKKGVESIPIQEQEGWENDEDMPEYYETVMRINGSDQGKIIKVPYDMEERLAQVLRDDPDVVEKFDYMHCYLSEVYTERSMLTDEDYQCAEQLFYSELGE